MSPKPVAKLSRQERLAKLTDKIKNTDTGGSGSQGFWSPKEGRNVIRILPEVKTMDFFFQTVGRHNFPPDGKKSAYCPKFTSENELPCPVCELVKDLYDSGVAENKELAGKLRVRKMYWMNVVVRGKDGADTGPFIYTPGVQVFTQLSALISDPDYGDIMDITDGIDVTIERTGSGLDTEYQVTPRRNSSALAPDQETIDKYIEEARDLSFVEASDDPTEDKELLKDHAVYLLPYDRLIRELDLDEDQDADEPADEPPAKLSHKTKHTVVEDDDDVEEEEPDEDDDEPEPVKTKPAAKQEVEKRLARRSLRR